MTTKDNPTIKKFARRSSLVSGAILILVGALVLLNNFIELPSFGNLFMIILGAIFLVGAFVSREGGLLIPGGILAGIGVGIYLVTGPFASATEEVQGGAFLLAFGAGWGLIALLSLLLRPVQWWPLIPGAILAGIGGLLLMGTFGLGVLEQVGSWWPLILIVIGAWIVIKRK